MKKSTQEIVRRTRGRDTVGNAAPPQPLQAAQTTRDIIGDFGPMDFYDANGNVVYQYDDLGNLVTDANKAGPRNDTLNDSTGNDHIVGGAGNDVIYLKRGGDDLVEAGTGDDFVSKTAAGNLNIDLGEGRCAVLFGRESCEAANDECVKKAA
jgi:Ca2+-binding RTX toxin-like protein